ncbi:hypothetical protein K470DRAFT_262643 [Piedraia hortae CBS 480.64]|uniref:RRM domain-containing protein n=1 Tax=Piedraia hortae CBS 480.64 TaxID=1314780 RepID=A0A6A7C5R5_9PEZI|nr:hypothetical protein K470DRAFT_262643 [Piedraia hortae CBS 480.64]
MAHPPKKQKLNGATEEKLKPQEPTLEAANQPNPEEKPTKSRTIFIRGLPPSTTSDSLSDLISESFPVVHSVAVTDKESKTCKGYGFVTLTDHDDAQRARTEFNGRTFQDRKLCVEIAEPRQRDSAKSGTDTSKPLLTTKLIIRNLPWSIKGPNQLERLFLSYGKVRKAYVPSKGKGLMAGFGFVVMRGRKNAEKAIEGVNGKVVDGRTLAVDWAVEKEVFEELQSRQVEGGVDETEAREGGSESEGDEADEDSDEDGEEDGDEEKIPEDEKDREDGEDGEDDDAPIDKYPTEDKSSTLFIRNLPFSCTDEDLEDHFASFGGVRYARVVLDPITERSKGTGFVSFYSKEDADKCLRNAPRRPTVDESNPRSVLQNDSTDPSGDYTLSGRVLQLSRAVSQSEATRLAAEGIASRRKRSEDKRHLYLLSEGTISPKSALWEKLPQSERTMREASARQRKKLIESNPALHLSLTRLSIRNLPRSVDSRALKALAREAIVGFAKDVKAGKRGRLSKEELARGGEEMQAAEIARKKAAKGVVKQAKVVFESAGGSRIKEMEGGRSRGYGFIEYHTHRAALMGLRWLNGHAVEYKVDKGKEERKKRLIVEFAIENKTVLSRREERERLRVSKGVRNERKRKREAEAKEEEEEEEPKKKKERKTVDEKTVLRNRIIGRKRAMRKARKS